MLLKELNTNLSSENIYEIFKDEIHSSFLDSSMVEDKLGKYSFIGLNPFKRVRVEKQKVYINDRETKEDIFKVLKDTINKYKFKNNTEIPFISGGIGYLSYDFGRTLEKFSDTAKEEVDIPLCIFNFYDNLIIFDHSNNKKYISSLGILEEEEESIKKILEKIENHKVKENHKKETIEVNHNYSIQEFSSNFSREEYEETVEKVRKYIEEGHIYITNLTQRFLKEVKEEPYNIYKKLRLLSPAPFAAYLNYEDFKILSSSPERFIKIEDKVVQTRPIKGTRPRGKTKKEDENNREELKNSEKDKSELLMIVDLERNDLSKVCAEHSVKVLELFEIEEYSTVFHLVSNINGRLREDKDCIDCIKATFPGGSITGAPKIRSMEIIEELEGLKRNIYTGSIGYIGFDGNCDFNIIIRTILYKDNIAYFGVGGGITYESEKEFEFEETLHKAKAIMKALS